MFVAARLGKTDKVDYVDNAGGIGGGILSIKVIIGRLVCSGRPAHEITGHGVFVVNLRVPFRRIEFLPQLPCFTIDRRHAVDIFTCYAGCISRIAVIIKSFDGKKVNRRPSVGGIPLERHSTLACCTCHNAAFPFKQAYILNHSSGNIFSDSLLPQGGKRGGTILRGTLTVHIVIIIKELGFGIYHKPAHQFAAPVGTGIPLFGSFHTEFTHKLSLVSLHPIEKCIEVYRVEIHATSVETGIEIPSRFGLGQKVCAGGHPLVTAHLRAVNPDTPCNLAEKLFQLTLIWLVMAVTVQTVGSQTVLHPKIIFFLKNREHAAQEILIAGSIVIVLHHHRKQRWLGAVLHPFRSGVRHIAEPLDHSRHILYIVPALPHIAVDQKPGIGKICIPIEHILESATYAWHTERLRKCEPPQRIRIGSAHGLRHGVRNVPVKFGLSPRRGVLPLYTESGYHSHSCCKNSRKASYIESNHVYNDWFN